VLSWLTWRIGAVALIILVGFGVAYFAPTAPEAPEDAIADCRSLVPPVLNPGENGVAMGLMVLATGETLPQLIRTMSVQAPAGDEAESDTVARLLARSPADLRDRPGNIVGRNLYRGDLEALLTT